jgi:Raf kinase inhibitor-like YbhB/YbcL family protein
MKKRLRGAVWLLALLVALSACRDIQPEKEGIGLELHVESSILDDGGAIPRKYTCDGDDVSPPLSWSEPPAETKSFVLIFEDPDAPAGTWVHWVLYNLAPTVQSLDEDVPADEIVEGVGTHGTNGWRRIGYGGPCPPQGAAHRYFFKVYALDTLLDLKAGVSKRDVEKAMAGHILATGQLMGRYGR